MQFVRNTSPANLTGYASEFLAHNDSLYGFALKLTRDEDDAMDLLQDTHLRALTYMDHYTTGTNARSWLYRIMYNLFINQYRRKKRSPFTDVESTDMVMNRTMPSVMPEAFRNTFSDEVMLAFNSLKPEFKTALYLRDFEDLKYEEIVRIIGVPMCTVKTRIHRARQLMKKMIREFEVRK